MNTKTKGILWYIGLAFGLAWINWGLLWMLGIVPATNVQMFQWLSLPAAFAPAIATLLVRWRMKDEDFSDAGLGLRLRTQWPFYLLAWLLPLLLVAVVILLAPLFGISTPDFSLARAYAAQGQPVADPPLLNRIPIFLLLSLLLTPLLWGEEFGWRGYLQIRLLADRPLLAAIVTGLIWGVWHYPLILMGFEYPDHRILGLLIFPVTTVLYSIVLGWFFLHTHTIWTASLFHSALNTVAGNMLMLLFLGGPNYFWLSHEGLLIWIPVALFSAWIIFTGQLHAESRSVQSMAGKQVLAG